MKTAFDELMNGLADVETYMSGKSTGFKVTLPERVDVKRIRTRLQMTQSKFSNCFGFSLDAVKHWEGGRRMPEASARAFLTVIDRNPSAVVEALHSRSSVKSVSSAHRVKAKAQAR